VLTSIAVVLVWPLVALSVGLPPTTADQNNGDCFLLEDGA
jgi:hypothetical protein